MEAEMDYNKMLVDWIFRIPNAPDKAKTDLAKVRAQAEIVARMAMDEYEYTPFVDEVEKLTDLIEKL